MDDEQPALVDHEPLRTDPPEGQRALACRERAAPQARWQLVAALDFFSAGASPRQPRPLPAPLPWQPVGGAAATPPGSPSEPPIRSGRRSSLEGKNPAP